MRPPTSERQLRRRYLLITGLRWLPIGFLTPVFVLLPLARGLSLPQVGVIFAVYGLTTALLELPTGGLADTIGRRLTLALSSVMHLAFFGLLLVAGDLLTWSVAMAAGGVARALDSGPLQAWYVDEARLVEPGVELRPGLSAAGVVEGAGLALSALAGGVIPLVADGPGLSSVVWAAVAVQVVHLALVMLLMPEHRPDAGESRVRWFTGVATVVRAGAVHGISRGPVRLLLLTTIAWGIGLAGIEILWQPRFITLTGGDPDAVGTSGEANTVLLGALMSGAFLIAAAGSMLAPWYARVLGGSAGRGVLVATVLHGSALGVLAASGLVVPAAAGFLAFYLMNGVRGPLHHELLHEHVPSERRSTMLSVESLSLQVGGLTATLALPLIAAASTISWAWAGVAVLLGLSALLYRGVPDKADEPLADG